MLGVGDREVWLIPGKDIFLVHFEVTSFLASGQETAGSSAALLLWEGREKRVKLGSVEERRLRNTRCTGLRPGKPRCPGQGDILGLSPPRMAIRGLRCGLFRKGVIWGELILDSCFTFIFKVEYFVIIGDNSLEKPFQSPLDIFPVWGVAARAFPT